MAIGLNKEQLKAHQTHLHELTTATDADRTLLSGSQAVQMHLSKLAPEGKSFADQMKSLVDELNGRLKGIGDLAWQLDGALDDVVQHFQSADDLNLMEAAAFKQKLPVVPGAAGSGAAGSGASTGTATKAPAP